MKNLDGYAVSDNSRWDERHFGAERGGDPPDYCSQAGAQALKAKIEAYWRERGHNVMLSLHNVGFHPAIRAARYDVRSDMVNGMPRSYGPAAAHGAPPPADARRRERSYWQLRMARVLVTGSSDGLGLMAARLLAETGHSAVLHARSAARADEARRKLPQAEAVLVGDLSSLTETRGIAEQANKLGRFDAVIHNAGVGLRERLARTAEGLPQVFAINVLAPYVLTALVERPSRLVYLSSGMHMQGHFRLQSFDRPTYSDSKLHVLMLTKGVARRWTDVYSNAVDPGWVPTKMGGKGAPDDLQKGYETQVWLATSNDAEAWVSGNYFHHQKVTQHNPEADDVRSQEKFLSLCEEVTGVSFP